MMSAVKVCPVCSREFAAGASHCPDDGVALVALSATEKNRPEELIGKVVEGRYRVERIVGRGGMGTVYAARHVVVQKPVALKVLRPSSDKAEGMLQRFIREAQTTNLLKSRHIVEIADFGQLPNGLLFVVMELLEGRDLTHAMRSGVLSRVDLIHIFIQIAETLGEAHNLGIVHRDLKPDNVFLVNEAGDPLFVKLLDFGIAKLLDSTSSGLTETGVILGTPYYMSPEQARADPVDHRTDIYALGVIMYRAFTGRLPFIADSTMGVITRHISEPPEPPSKVSAVHPKAEVLILRCLEKRPQHRPQSMREVSLELRSMLRDERQSRRGAESTATNDRGIKSVPPPSGIPALSRPASGDSYRPPSGDSYRPPPGDSYRPPPGDSYPSSAHSSGPHGSGPHGSGPHGSGPHGSGPHGSGPHGSGPHGSDPHGSGPHGSGPHGSGPHGSGPHRTGSHPSGSHPSGSHPSGSHQSGSHPSGAHRGTGEPHPFEHGELSASGRHISNAPGSISVNDSIPRYTNPPSFDSALTSLRWPPGTTGATGRGVVTSSLPPPTVRQGTMLVVGAIALFAAGALAAALLLLSRPPAPSVTSAGTAVAASPPVTAAPASAAPTVLQAPPAPPAPPPSTATGAASAARSAAAPQPRPRVVGPTAPPAKPSATATPKRPTVEIRSPFD